MTVLYLQVAFALIIITGYFTLGRYLSRTPDAKAALIMGFAIGGLALAGDFFCAWFVSPDRGSAINDFALLIGGGTAGWLVGILLTPGPDEKHEFRDWGKAVITFASGILTSKFAEPLTHMILEGRLKRVWLGEALVTINAFLICMVMVFVARRYWTTAISQKKASMRTHRALVAEMVRVVSWLKSTIGDGDGNGFQEALKLLGELSKKLEVSVQADPFFKS
jgi:hypothetical protein